MTITITVGMGSCGIAAGANQVSDAITQAFEKNSDLKKLKDNSKIRTTGCMGMCHKEVLLYIENEKNEISTFCDVLPKDAESILLAISASTFENEKLKHPKLLSENMEIRNNLPFFSKQKRIVLRNVGKISPISIEEYENTGGYKALDKAISKMTSQSIIETISESGLRGRGGAGFPTGTKWKFAAASKSDDNMKYVVCNGDEGDPGAFMDRSVLEGDPHSVIEGMSICARAIGASKGYIYVRAEYPLAVKNLNIAIKAAEEKGWIGTTTKWDDFSFKLSIREGAGAFVCGEETALLASIEGKRGMPRLRPPFPAVKGLYARPTNINNVETYANIAWIINNGGEAFSKMGVNRSRGTKVFALAGKIKHGGLIEVPMGISVREIIFDVGGGMSGDLPFKAVQLGGPSGGCIPESLIDTPVDYEELGKTGAIVGSGGMIVMDQSTCMVDIARFFLSFTQEESCGKCTFCRIGTKRMLEILTKICEGHGKEGDIELLEDLAIRIKDSSLCGLGQTAPNPVLTTIKYFRHEYEAHIRDKKCPAACCKALIDFSINDNCIGCGACKRACPVNAISGNKKERHKIDQSKCIKCGACISACKFKAVEKH